MYSRHELSCKLSQHRWWEDYNQDAKCEVETWESPSFAQSLAALAADFIMDNWRLSE